jgi:Vitamin K epoxide reductase family
LAPQRDRLGGAGDRAAVDQRLLGVVADQVAGSLTGVDVEAGDAPRVVVVEHQPRALLVGVVHYRGYVSPCYVVHGCEEAQTSRYSVIMGVPLALLDTVFVALMLYLSIGLLTSSRVLVVRVYKVLAFAGALAIIPLFLLQAIVLKAFARIVSPPRRSCSSSGW